MVLKNVKIFIIELLFDKHISFMPKANDKNFWENLVKIGSNQIIIPAIYFKLKERKLINKIPQDLKKYLSEIYNFNSLRNKDVLFEINKIEKELKKNKIDFIFLKGASLLKTIYIKNIGIRMMHDIDILIRKKHIILAKKILNNLNYNDRGFENKIVKTRHLPILINKENSIGVELHYELTKENSFFDYNKIFKKNNLNILSINDNLNHVILNLEKNDDGSLLGTINLRAKFDFFNLNKLKNNFSFNRNIYTKRFKTKVDYLEIYNKIKSKNLYYYYLLFNRTILGKLTTSILKFFINLKLIFMQILEFIINPYYRENVLKIIAKKVEK